MYIKIVKFLIVGIIVLGIFSCSWTKKTFRETKKLYKEYVLPTTRVDMKGELEASSCDLSFASFLNQSDAKLEELLLQLDLQETFPQESWAKELFEKFNWLSKLEVIDEQGEIFFAYPKTTLKQIDFSYLGKRLKDIKKLDSDLKETILGPELVIFKPIYTQKGIKLLLLVHFDPRSLLALNKEKRVNLYFNFQIIYKGITEELPQFKQSFPISGKLALDEQKMLWLSRKVGKNWFSYVYLCEEGR